MTLVSVAWFQVNPSSLGYSRGLIVVAFKWITAPKVKAAFELKVDMVMENGPDPKVHV